MNRIEWTVKATRQLTKIRDKPMRQRIYLETQTLESFPNCKNVKSLANHEFSYRLRVGTFRVFFEFDGTLRIVSIEEVKKRNERTY